MNTNNSTIIARAFIAGAILVAAYLAFVGLGGAAVVGCGPESACGSVLASSWSKVAGVPVAAIGLGFYLIAFAFAPSVRSGAKSAAGFAGMFGIAAIFAGAIVFLGLQFLSGQICLWCTIAHLLAVGGRSSRFPDPVARSPSFVFPLRSPSSRSAVS